MRINIFAKLALTILVLVAGLVIFLGLSTRQELETSFASLVKQREERVANGIGLEIDILLTELANQLKGMADNFDLRRRLVDVMSGTISAGDPGLIQRVGELRNIADIEWLWLISPDGILLSAGHDPQAFGDDLLDLSTPHGQKLSEALQGKMVQTIAVESISAQNTLVAEVFLPVTISDRFLGREQVIGVLWGATQIDDDFLARAADLAGGQLVVMGESINPIVSWKDADESTDVSLLDALQQNRSEISIGNETYGITTLTFPRSEETGKASTVRLFLLTPKSDLIAGRRALLTSIVLEAVLAGIVAIGFAFLIAKSITLPIERLKTAVTALASGDLSRRVEVSSHDEVEDLVKAFNMMANDLEVNTRRLVEAEKLSAWREVARRLAHEIKNPLSPIKLSIQNLVRVYQTNPDTFATTLFETSQTILEEVERLTKLADEFSNFARMPKPVLVQGDLGEVIKGVIALFDKAETGVEILYKSSKPLPKAMIDRDAMSRAFTNLLKNAVEAMRGRTGNITVSAGTQKIGDKVWIQVRMKDEGIGMDENALKHSFNPYFTTKKGGSGLGLAIVQSIISDHGGRVSISSEVGKGTVVIVEIPAV